MSLLVIDGLTGTGKSSVLTALISRLKTLQASYRVIYEEETFGELMDEIRAGVPENFCWRLKAVLNKLSELQTDWVILERFYLSYYALVPEWARYSEFDQQLNKLGAQLVLLTYPPERVAQRALYRYERQGWAEGYIDLYGSEAATLEALQTSLKQREKAFELSQLPKLKIDTSASDWTAYAELIQNWVSSPRMRTPLKRSSFRAHQNGSTF